MHTTLLANRRSRGLTLSELVICAVTIGVLASFGVPKFVRNLERSKASEAIFYLATIRSAQQRYHEYHGTYAEKLEELSLQADVPKAFTVRPIEAGPTGDLKESWSLTLRRRGLGGGYGHYTVVFNNDGFDPAQSDIPGEVNPIGGSRTSVPAGSFPVPNSHSRMPTAALATPKQPG